MAEIHYTEFKWEIRQKVKTSFLAEIHYAEFQSELGPKFKMSFCKQQYRRVKVLLDVSLLNCHTLTIQAILILTGDIGGLLEGLLGFSWDPLGVGLGSVGSPLGFNGGQFGVQ